MPRPGPTGHRCTEQTIDYSLVDEGEVACTEPGCGRVWRRTPGNEVKWWVNKQ